MSKNIQTKNESFVLFCFLLVLFFFFFTSVCVVVVVGGDDVFFRVGVHVLFQYFFPLNEKDFFKSYNISICSTNSDHQGNW